MSNSENTAALQSKANFTSSLPSLQQAVFKTRTPWGPNPLLFIYPKHTFAQPFYKVIQRCQNHKHLFVLSLLLPTGTSSRQDTALMKRS